MSYTVFMITLTIMIFISLIVMVLDDKIHLIEKFEKTLVKIFGRFI